MADESLQLLLQRAVELHRAGKSAEALPVYESVLARDPNNADALHLLGLARHQATGDVDAAAALIRRAIAIQPAAADYHANLATLFAKAERLDEAAMAMRQASKLRPDDEAFRRRLASYLLRLGVQQTQLDRPVAAVAALEQVLKLAPDSAEALGNLGHALSKLKRLDEAVARYQQAIALKPDVPELHTNLGAALLALGRVEEAVAAHRRACELAPGWTPAMSNLAIALQQVGGTDEALELHEAVLRQNPDDPTALFNRGVIRLTRGDFAGGWRDYEARFRVRELRGQRTFPQPRWTGEEDVAGRTVLVHAEQGLGDTIQFVRYLPQLVARGAAVVVLCDRLLVRLLRHSFPDVRVVAEGEPLPAFDLHVPVMSLPFAFGTTIETVPAISPYLRVPPESIDKVATHIRDDGFRVGLVWAGNPGHYNDRNRSIRLDQLLSFVPSQPTLHLYSLQKGPGAEQLVAAATARSREIVDLAAHFSDLSDTAAAIAKLDLVISVDTSIAHLAGALDTNVWTLLPEPPDFRWMSGRDDSPWYPTMWLFRQARSGDWDEVFRRVGNELARLHALKARDT